MTTSTPLSVVAYLSGPKTYQLWATELCGAARGRQTMIGRQQFSLDRREKLRGSPK